MKNLVGERYGRVVVTRFDRRDKNRYYWRCKCDCGNKFVTRADGLGGRVRSCGECVRHLGVRPLYFIWKAMLSRCTKPESSSYERYGGRGIRVCDEWLDYFQFHKWAKRKYKAGLSIDRIDNDGPYAPDNCRWTTDRIQLDNRSNTIWIEHSGQRKTLSEWADHLGIKYDTLYTRVQRYGWSAERALTTVRQRVI
jgi:hypothetical protein